MDFFREIPMEMRPKIRYWLPSAAVDEADLREEIRQLKGAGIRRCRSGSVSVRSRRDRTGRRRMGA